MKPEHDPKLPSGRQAHPQVASAKDIAAQKNIAAGQKFNKPEENQMSPEQAQEQNEETNSQAETQVEASNTSNTDVASETANVEHQVQHQETDVALSEKHQEINAALSEARAEVSLEPVEEEAEEFQFIEDSENLFEEVLEPVNFQYISNVLVFTFNVDSTLGEMYCEDDSVFEKLLCVPEVLVEDEDFVEGEKTVNVQNPIAKKVGWLRNSLPRIVKFANSLSQQRLPILAGTTQAELASSLIADNICTMMEGVVTSTVFGNNEALSGYISTVDDSDEDEDSVAEVSLVHGLGDFLEVTSYSNYADEDTHNIVTNFDITNPRIFASSKPGVYVTKLVEFMQSRVADCNIPVYVNFTFTAADIVNLIEYRDMVDALVEMGCEPITRTQALDFIDEDFGILPIDLDVAFASDLDSLFGQGDILLTVCLNPDEEDEEDEEESVDLSDESENEE